MRKGTPKKDHEHVITVYGGTGPWKQRLGFQSPHAAYLILLDRRGVVRWRHNGALEEESYKALSIQVAALLREPQ
jgi:predicted transcriptional regulator